jgi:hypothetical protein
MARSLAAQVILTVITLSRFHESPTEGQGHARKQRLCQEYDGWNLATARIRLEKQVNAI